ncbi:uncharacterized protein si:ch211-59o9.10 [Triplophysa dalaica]|uniref:uncharacterized protein si:ch211-59o9.10 n=1 Tax=Triplophysa dalaica TaxID=1582913 RepID=UPI0024DF71CC|nr:uncharacterized protein si:ch211-59o9.10 [Triplophysa dalaica]
MDHIQDISEPSSPLFSPRGEPDTPDFLNNACLLNDSDFLMEDPGVSCDMSTIVPETPSPLTHSKKRNAHKNWSAATSTDLNSGKREIQENIPGYLSTTPSSQRTLKRRKLADSNPSTRVCGNSVMQEANGFVPASSLLPNELTWLESPRPATSSTCQPFASFKPSSSAGSSTCALGQSSDQMCLNGLLGHMSKQETLGTCNGKEQRSKKTVYSKSRSKTSKSTSHEPKTDSPVFGREDGGLPFDAARMQRPASTSACQIPKDIVIIEDDGDDVTSECMVRSIQMVEDEAYARSLQEQFDIEQRLDQEQQRLQRQTPSTNHQTSMVDPYVGLGWISPWASMINSASFSHGASELQQIMFGEQHNRQQGRRPTGRPRNSRRRGGASNLQMDLLDDSQGNNYEALLAFEEQQGAVLTKNTLSKAEIERLPVKTYDPSHSAGKTDCQICFSEYKKNERLRMLPCLHDYHVKCIDRWLKENATCPICRADVSTCGEFS